MTADARPSPLTRALDFLFGKSLTPEEKRRFEAARPPKTIENVYGVLSLTSVLAVLTVFLGGYGWLPFVDARIDQEWFWPVFGVNVLLRFGWELVKGLYERRARVGEALKSANPE